jgi:ABC-type Mn2+/Zn2+ transport system permease subunit
MYRRQAFISDGLSHLGVVASAIDIMVREKLNFQLLKKSGAD